MSGFIACARSWEASAIEDGRLGAEGRAAFERHAETCADCAHEVAELAKLRAFIDADDRPTATPLEHRRLRAEVLRRVNGAALAPSFRARKPAFALMAAAAVVLAFVLARRASPVHLPTSVVATAASAHYDVVPRANARWRASQLGGTTRVALEDGEAMFHVDHLGRDQRFLVALPDGEVEVRGTRFSIEVENAKTRRVRVTEGHVVMRLDAQGQRDLYAGDVWERAPEATAIATTTAAPIAPIAPTPTKTETIATTATPAAPAKSPTIAVAAKPSATTAPTMAASAPTSSRFGDAMKLFREGRYADADAAFADFEIASPSDPRAEDAAWLRAVARSRAGDAAGAARLAQRYLDRYPQGLRRAEAEALVKAGKS